MQHNVSLKRNEIYHINLSIKIGKTLKTPKIVNFDQVRSEEKDIFYREYSLSSLSLSPIPMLTSMQILYISATN